MYQLKISGLILRTGSYGESDKMLTALTAEKGRICIAAKGGKSLKRGAFLNNFCYCDFILSKRGDIYSLNSAQPIESFFGISKSIENLFAASGITSFAAYISNENQPASELLRLCLNCIYALSETDTDYLKILLAFYIKSAQISGVAPETFSCVSCGESDNLTHFSPSYGGTLCENCGGGTPEISGAAVLIMKYILSADLKDILKFSAENTDIINAYELIKAFIKEHFDYNIKEFAI